MKKISHRSDSKNTLLVGLILLMGLFLVSFTSALNWTDGIEAYYKLDETTGSIADNVVSNFYNLSAGGGTPLWNTSGKINGNSQFNLSNIYFQNKSVFNYNDINTGLTMNLWFNPDNTATQEKFLAGKSYSNGQYVIELFQKNNTIRARSNRLAGTSEIYSSTTITAGNWYMATVVSNSTGIFLFVNGVLSNSVANSNNYTSTSLSNFSIGAGAYESTVWGNYTGRIDEVGLWNRSLRVSEITELYNGGSGLNYGGLGFGITLISPSNNTIISTDSTNFTANFNITGTNEGDYVWKNATFQIWREGVQFNFTDVSLSGNNTIYTLEIGGLTSGNYEWNVMAWYGNATYNNHTSAKSNFTFDWRPFEIVDQSYENYVYETDYQGFNLSINTLEDILTVTSKLNYNGVEYSAVSTSTGGGDYDIYSLIDVPLVSSGESINYSFYWTITVFDGTNSYSFDTVAETMQQNVTRIHLEECAGAYTTQTLNFSAYREDNLTRINPFKIQGSFDNWLGSGTVYREQSFDKTSTAYLALCLTPTAKTQYTNAQIRYSYEDENVTFVPRDYYFLNASLTNTSQEIDLYLLEAEDSTTFILKVQDEKLSAVEDALIYIQKYFLSDGTYKTVQVSKTDSNGETIGFYQTETVDYKHIITKNGTVLLETSPQKVVGKEVPFTLTFTVGEALTFPWSPFEKNSNIQSSLTYNKTSEIVTFTYIDTTGATTLGRLLVVQPSLMNSTNIVICNVSSSQSSATLTCNMSGYEGSFVAYGYIETEVSDLINFVMSVARDIFGREGLLFGLMIILVAGFAFIWNPTAAIISVNAATILVSMIGFITISPIFIFAMMCVSLIAIILLKT